MVAFGPAQGIHAEALLAAVYGLLLLLIALGIERLARRSHLRAESYERGGFVYHAHLDAWECPAGAHLLRIGVEYEHRLTRYRAPATTCNRCPLKAGCTDSEHGRELTRSLDPWLESEIGRFHRGLSLVLVGLAGFIIALALVRNHADADALVLLPTLLLVLVQASHYLRRGGDTRVAW